MRKRLSKTFFRIFLPLTAIICITVVFITLLFSTVFEKNGIETLGKEYQKNLHMIRNLYTEIHFAVIPAALNVFSDNRVRDFLFAEQFQYDIVLSGLKEIDKTIILNNYIHSIYLYNQESGFLSTLKGYRSKTQSSDPTLLPLLHGPRFAQSAIVARRVLFEGDKTPENLFSFINGGFDSQSGAVKYAFIFNLSESKIRKMLVADYPENEAEFYILDSNGMFLSHPQAELFNTACEQNGVIHQVMAESSSSGVSFFADSENNRYLATWSDQSELGWRFLYLVSEKKLFASVTELKNKLYAISALVLSLSLALLMVMTYRIQAAVEFEKKFSAYIQGISDFSEKKLAAKNWYLGLLRFDLISGTGHENHALQFHRHTWLSAELNARREKTLCVHLFDNQYCIVCETSSSLFYDDFFSLREKLVSGFNSEVTAVYDATPCAFDEIPALYERLRDSLRQTYMVSQGLTRKISRTAQLPERAKKAKPPDEFDFTAFEQTLKTGNSEKLRLEINRLRDYLFEKKEYVIFRTAAVQTGLIAAKLFEQSLDPFLSGGMNGWRGELFQCEQISAFMGLLTNLCDAMENSRNLPDGSNAGKITRHIKNVVTENVHDKNLNSALIADKLGLSLNYVRELFKRNENLSINDYIGLYRVELAKQYLAGTDKTIYEICDIVGFSNYSYFCTYFKKTESLSPSEYRMNLRISK